MTVPLSVCVVVKLYIISIVLLSVSEVDQMLVDIIRKLVYAFIGRPMSCIIQLMCLLMCY